MITSLIPSFNAGELSPLIHLRSDLEKYRSGCRTLQNMLITPYGGVRRRAGLSYTATAPGKCRLFRFQASISKGYILEVSGGKIRFYLRDRPVQTDADEDYEIDSPYAVDDLWGVQMAQVNNVAYFTHPLYPVHKLSRIANDNWEFLPVEFSYPAMLEENLRKARTFTTSEAGEEGDTIDIEASWDFFSSKHEGAYLELSHERGADQFEVELEAISANDGLFSDSLIVQGAWNITTRGTWTGTFEIQRNSGSGWDSIRKFTSAADANYSAGGDEPARVLMRLKWTHGADGTSTPKAILEASGAFITGLVKITSVNDLDKATVEVIRPVENGATSYWRESAWSAKRGYPRTVAAHEQRLVFGGNEYRPQTVWASAVDDFEDFEPGEEDSDSWAHTIVSGQQNDIQWIASHKALLIGTTGDEWVISATKEEAIITPTNVRARRHSGNGSDFLKARLLDDSVLFVQRGGKVLREMSYAFEADGYVTTDLTLLAEHITGDGIIDTAYQAQPESILWSVTKGGDLIALTYDKAQNIAGWHRHTTGGAADGFESVAVKSVEGEADQVWVVVRRTINGAVVRYIERFKPDGWFLETPWDLLFPDTDGIRPWSYRFVSYEKGDLRINGQSYLCTANHESTLTTFEASELQTPISLSQNIYTNWHQVDVWPLDDSISISFGWDVGYWVVRNGIVYEAIQAQASGTNPLYWPGTGAQTADYWVVVTGYTIDHPAEYGDILAWVRQTDYTTGDVAVSGRYVYRCISTHTPGTTTRPTSGVSWGTKWERMQGSYLIGDLVSSEGVNYICIQDNTPTLNDEPGKGVNWGDYWEVSPTDNLIFHVDSGKTLINPGTLTEMTGLDHLEGETVQIVANGAVLTPRAVTDGAIQFDQEGDPTTFTDVCAGLAFESILEPMALEVGMQNGTSVSREKRIHELVIYLKDSYGCKVSDRINGTYDTLSFYDTGDINAPSLFTGPMLHKLDSRHDLEASFVLKQDLPMPLKVLAIVPKWNVYGDNS